MTASIRHTRIYILCGILLFFAINVQAQVEVEPWGNITAIRVKGQPMQFESSLRVVSAGWSSIKETAMERQRPKYRRDGAKQIINTEIDSIKFTETIQEAGEGAALVAVE